MKKNMPKFASSVRSSAGFTLVELMLVVAIIGILAGIAIPAYNSYVRSSHRTDATSSLSEYQAMFERCYATNNQYPLSTDTTGCIPNTVLTSLFSSSGMASGQGNYTITATSTATSYTLTATATGPQASDKSCVVMTLDQTGQKVSKDNTGAVSTGCGWP